MDPSWETKRICIVEKAVDENSTEENKPWLYSVLEMDIDNATLVSAAMKLMLSIVISSSVSTIAFILKNDHSYSNDIMCNLYVAVILLWIALMSVLFFRFMWSGFLKDKPHNVKACSAFGMAVNLLAVFSSTIYACSTIDTEVLLSVMLFIGFFNSMVMFMFHDTTMQKELQKEENSRPSMYTHKIFGVPKGFEISVEEEQGK